MPHRFQFRIHLTLMLLVLALLPGMSAAIEPPRSGMATPPTAATDPSGRLDPTWVAHRGQVLLVMYSRSASLIPPETLARVSQWQDQFQNQGLQVVVIVEAGDPPAGLHPNIIVARDAVNAEGVGYTRKNFAIVSDYEYFIIDRFGRLRRQRINETLVRTALTEYFDPSWVGISGAWNQSYLVHDGQFLIYLVDTQPDALVRGEAFDVRVVALPTLNAPVPKARINQPIQIEIRSDGDFEQPVYRSQLDEDLTVSTEMLMEVRVNPDARLGMHVLWVRATHTHCGFGDCGPFSEQIPVPVWVME